ncbi:hypothetical protein DY000_02061335 [Brassica cretica]|uniref:Uncharacterized protein n=1 Tax=Brassica cretica TaxID=69181 RepID=A0ABQ7AUJ9_BRACR|nr:hypothetical protein DY000_02061335 [Brassica cretica]
MNHRKFSTNISSEYTEGLLPRNIPRDSFLRIFRGLRSSEIPDENSEEHFVGTSEDWTIGKSIEISRDHRKVHRNIPRKFSLGIFRGPFRRTGGHRSFLGNSFPRNSVGNFRGKMIFRGVISEDLFRRYVVGITLFQRHTDDFFPRYAAVFL